MMINKHIWWVISTIVDKITNTITPFFIKGINWYRKFLPNSILAEIIISFFLYIITIITWTYQDLVIISTFFLIIWQIIVIMLFNI